MRRLPREKFEDPEAMMMSDPPASERAYQRLKDSILSGTLPSGSLEIGGLADQMRMSITPVREALARLNVERLVKLTPHQGYVIATPTPARLEHLYELSGTLIHLGLERANRFRRKTIEQTPTFSATGSYADDMTRLLRDVVSGQPNVALVETIASLTDQLFASRRCELRVFPDGQEELAVLISLWTKGNLGDLRLRLKAYHRTRILKVDAISRLLLGEGRSS